MRNPAQGPPIDVWAAGVIALCIVTRRYPFFEAESDMDALCEIHALLNALSHEPPRAKSGASAAELRSAEASSSLARLMLVYRAPSSQRSVGQGEDAWAAALGGGLGSLEGAGEMLWPLLDGCLRFDESERKTAKEILEMDVCRVD